MTSVAAMPAQLPGLQNQERNWVYVGSARNVNSNNSTTGTSQTKLLFNEAIPVSVVNRATRVGPPAPIMIEKLLPRPEMRESPNSLRSSRSFSVLSEERLQAAVKLAKRDLRRRHLGSLAKTSPKHLQEASVFETSDTELLQELVAAPGKQELNVARSKEKTTLIGATQRASKKNPSSLMPGVGRSPPTRDPGLRQMEGGKHGHLSNEIRKLQNELETYIRKVEELANRGEKLEEVLDPEEQIKLEMRRQKQAARSARIIYVLQRQVKEIQDDIEKLKREKMWETKKSAAVGRLAAAHRGALRALQVVVHQLSDRPHGKVPPHYKELGQLLRQLSLCSVEADQGSAAPETALDILQKLEILDSALSKQEMLEKLQAQTRPPRGRSPHRSASPTTWPRCLSVPAAPGPLRPANPRGAVHGGRKVVLQKPKLASHQPPVAAMHTVGQQRELQRPNANHQSRRNPGRRRADVMKVKDAGFRQPTVSSQLRVSQLPQREKTVPWIPTSPHSPPRQQAPQRWRPEPRCLFSPVKPPPSPLGDHQAGGQSEAEQLVSAMQRAAPKEATRTSYQEKTTTQLSEEEAPRLHGLRSEVVFQNQWAGGDEHSATEGSQRLSGETQQEGVAESKPDKSRTIWLPERDDEVAAGDQVRLGEHQEEDLLKDTAPDAWAVNMGMGDATWRGLQAYTLERMLLRTEEMQREEEEVRRRFTFIAYSDPLYWDRSTTRGSQPHPQGSRPASPQPIRLTRPAPKQTAAADIILEKPIEAGFLFESSPTEVQNQDQHLPTNKVWPNDRAQRSRTVLSVPGNTLKNIRQYKEDYNSYLGAVSRRAVDSFNPWAAVDRVAEELLSEVLAEVAEEFQDVVEEYAEAVFTSEFLRPVHSGPASASAVAGRNQ